MLLFGASGHAKVILSCLRACSIEADAFFDDDPHKTELWDVPVLGPYQADYKPDTPLIISVGYNHIRQHLATRICHRFGQVIHPSALVDASVRVGEGTVIIHRAVIQADAQIGKHVIINTGASVDHDSIISDFVHIAPQATLCGNVRVGEGSLVGAGAVIAPNLTIGRWAMIGAGTIITRDVPDYAVVRGAPGRIVKLNTPNVTS